MTHTAAERSIAPAPTPHAPRQQPAAGGGERESAARRRRVPTAAAAAGAALAIVLIAVHVALAWYLRPLWLDVGDDATYVLLGRSLRSFSYRSIFLAGAPRHVQYPPGFPALLAATAALFGERIAAFAAVQSLLSGAALALLFDAVRRRWSLGLALLLLAACAVNPLLVASAPSLLSETPFVALCALSLWAAARELEGPRSARWLVVAGAAALAAALTRTAGVALVAALIVAWASERRWRPAAVLLAAAAVALGGWFLWTALAPRDALHYGYAADLARGYGGASASPSAAAAAPTAPSAGGMIGTVVRGAGARVVEYLTRIVPFSLPLPTVEHTRVDNVAWLAFMLGFGALGAWALWRRWRAAVLFVVCYAAVLAAWPWALERLLLPALPLVLLALLAGVQLAAERWPGAPFARRVWRVLPMAFVAAVTITAVARDATTLRRRHACLAAAAPNAPACLPAQLRGIFDAADYVRDHSAPGDTVLVFYGAGLYARAERVTLPIGAIAADTATSAPVGGEAAPPPSSSSDGKFVVLTLNSWNERTIAAAASLRGYCDRLTVVRTFPPSAMVLRTSRPAAPDSGRATCAALDRLLTANSSRDADGR